jgi:hypothetical protein
MKIKKIMKKMNRYKEKAEGAACYLEGGNELLIENMINSFISWLIVFMKDATEFLLNNEKKIIKIFLNKKIRIAAAKIIRLSSTMMISYILLIFEIESFTEGLIKSFNKLKFEKSEELKYHFDKVEMSCNSINRNYKKFIKERKKM